jgi:hypothetical protein
MTRAHYYARMFAAAALGSAILSCAPPPQAQPGIIPELAGRIAGPPQTCVSIISTTSLRIVDSRTLLYGSGSTLWVNHPATECRGATSMDILVTQPTGSQYCRGDIVRSVDPVSRIPGPSCVLGDFVPYRR